MRILSVSNFFDTHGGGLERVAGHLSREFIALGHDASWAACDGDGLPDSPAATVVLRCANAIERLTGLPVPLPGPKSFWRLWTAVRASELVVIHDALYASSIAAMAMAKFAGKRTVLIQHIGSIRFSNPILTAIMRLANSIVTKPMMLLANELVFISATVREEFAGVSAQRSSLLIFNGVDAKVFFPKRDADTVAIRRHFGLPESKPLAVFVGRLVEKKGLEIIRQVASSRPDLAFAIVGQGPIDPRTWRIDNVHVIGQLPQSGLANLYRASDVLLLPSVGEGYPLVIQEAMACGLPAVTGDIAARADPDATRWLSGVSIDLSDPAGSSDRCSSAIDRVLGDPPARDQMSSYALENYNWNLMARKIVNAAKG